MSTIRVDSFAPAIGGTSFGNIGIARGIWYYDQITPATKRSENVSSITDNSTGKHTVNWSNVFDAADVATPATGGMDAATANVRICTSKDDDGPSASTKVVETRNNAATVLDSYSHGAAYGDLA